MSLATMNHAVDQDAATTKVAKAPRATSRRASQVAERPKKVSFYLSPDAIRRLGVVASMEDTDKSKVLERVIRESATLKRWVVQDRARPDAAPDTGEGRQDVAAA